jgi:pimeloyl-ACP methyl ester carboxylesterase
MRYLCVSRPGYLGTPLRTGTTPRLQGDAILHMLDTLGIEKCSIMAISGGGPSALNFTHAYPDRCHALILCSTLGGPQPQKIPFSFTIMSLMAQLSPVARSIQKKMASDLETAVSRSITDPELRKKVMDDDETFDLYKVVLLDSFNHFGRRMAGTKNDIQISSTFSIALNEIQVPTLVIHGTLDPMLPFEKHGKVLAESIPGAELFVAEGGEHPAIFTHREAVRKRVAKFLA